MDESLFHKISKIQTYLSLFSPPSIYIKMPHNFVHHLNDDDNVEIYKLGVIFNGRERE